MLQRTFIHLPGVGPRRETHFWRQGLSTWKDFLAAKRVKGLSRERLDWLKAELTGSLEHLSDAAMFPTLLNRQAAVFQRPPRQLAADGGFASRENLRLAKDQGVKEVMFAKRRGPGVLEMLKSLWVYKKLRNFRSGIEANIPRLKRVFGLDRCNWQAWPGFRQHV